MDGSWYRCQLSKEGGKDAPVTETRNFMQFSDEADDGGAGEELWGCDGEVLWLKIYVIVVTVEFDHGTINIGMYLYLL